MPSSQCSTVPKLMNFIQLSLNCCFLRISVPRMEIHHISYIVTKWTLHEKQCPQLQRFSSKHPTIFCNQCPCLAVKVPHLWQGSFTLWSLTPLLPQLETCQFWPYFSFRGEQAKDNNSSCLSLFTNFFQCKDSSNLLCVEVHLNCLYFGERSKRELDQAGPLGLHARQILPKYILTGLNSNNILGNMKKKRGRGMVNEFDPTVWSTNLFAPLLILVNVNVLSCLLYSKTMIILGLLCSDNTFCKICFSVKIFCFLCSWNVMKNKVIEISNW